MSGRIITLLWAGDAVSQTGFARVTHGVLDQLYMTGDYDIHVLGVNYSGDPHDYPYKIYPARLGGDLLGYNRLRPLVEHIKPDIIVLFNDIWVIIDYFHILEEMEYRGKTVTYFPVDAEGYMPEWAEPLNKMDRVFVYTKFASRVLRSIGLEKNPEIIPHGINTSIYHPMDKKETRRTLNGLNEEDFIVFNGNRNQPRKRIDITIKGFCQFAVDKPETRLYLHMGLVDTGWHIIPLMERECKRCGIGDMGKRLIITHPDLSPANSVTEAHLNSIYNSADIGLNTSMGEGWGLVPFEHAACKVPQILTNYAAGAEVFGDGRGLLIPIRQVLSNLRTNTEAGLVHEDDVADALNKYYYNADLREAHAAAMYKYIQRDEFRWENIAKTWDQHFKELIK